MDMGHALLLQKGLPKKVKGCEAAPRHIHQRFDVGGRARVYSNVVYSVSKLKVIGQPRRPTRRARGCRQYDYDTARILFWENL